MPRSGDLEPEELSAADEHFRQYQRLVSGWIDVFLETQKSFIAHPPTLDGLDTTDETRRQEADATSGEAAV